MNRRVVAFITRIFQKRSSLNEYFLVFGGSESCNHDNEISVIFICKTFD